MELNQMYEIFPALLEIRDEELRRKCASVFKQGFEERNWTVETLRQSPIDMDNRKHPGNNLDHFQDVAMVAMLSYDYMKNKYGDLVKVSRDYVVASALLHDVGKLYEYTHTPDGPDYAPDCPPVRHPLKGAIIADGHGIPKEIIHAIATHSFEGDRSLPTLEYHFVRNSDAIAFYSLNY